MLAQSTRIFGFHTTGSPGTATVATTGGTWYGITCEIFVQDPPLLIGSSDLINQTKRPILPIKQNFQAYNSDRQNVQSYRSDKIS